MEGAAVNYAAAAVLDSDGETMVLASEFLDALPDDHVTLEVCRKVSRTNPLSFIHQRLARCCWSLGEYEEAAQVYRALIARRTLPEAERLELELSLAQLLLEKGDAAEGLSLMEQVLPRLGSDQNVLELQLSLADHYLNAGRFESALKIFLQRAGNSIPCARRAELLRKASRCYHGLRQYDKAIGSLIEILTFVRETGPTDDPLAQSAIITDPHFYEDVYSALAQNYEAKGDLSCARGALKKEAKYHCKGCAIPQSDQQAGAA